MTDEYTLPMTVFDALVRALKRAAEYNPETHAAPVCVLWTDEQREWEQSIEPLREALPQIFVLGPYNPDKQSGPAIWLKCVIAATLPDVKQVEDAAPILYLPGVSRKELRAIESCPPALAPLAELQYRGTFWTQANARDWTILAFLQSRHGGLGLDVAQDQATRQALPRALPELLRQPLESLRDRRLEAADFDALLVEDLVRDVLVWLDRPADAQRSWRAGRWDAFCSNCREQLDFEPQHDDPLTACEKLAAGAGRWKTVWARFTESPRSYPALPDLLRRSKPAAQDSLFFSDVSEIWPQDNERMEHDLRDKLSRLDQSSPQQAAESIARLEALHAQRREWVWAESGHAPLARALAALHRMVMAQSTPVAGTSLTDMAAAYADHGWQIDAAALEAMACVESLADSAAIKTALSALYRPWLERLAERLQDQIRATPFPTAGTFDFDQNPVEPGTIILFVDALRYDIGQQLRERLLARGLTAVLEWRWTVLPTVTATCKTALSPIAPRLDPHSRFDDFYPQTREASQRVDIHRFRKLLVSQGYQIIAADEVGEPDGMGWTEVGNFDRSGHDEGWKLAWRIEEILKDVEARIAVLLQAGWNRVRIVTDHGWLWLPGGLPRVDLPAYLAETRWGRCAVLKETTRVEIQTVPWFWNSDLHVAMAAGIQVFTAGKEYAHGGISLQECLVPELTVLGTVGQTVQVSIDAVRWTRMRGRITARGEYHGLCADLRTRAGDVGTSVLSEPKALDEQGKTAVLVENDDLEGTAAILVLLNAQGEVIIKQATTIGGE